MNIISEKFNLISEGKALSSVMLFYKSSGLYMTTCIPLQNWNLNFVSLMCNMFEKCISQCEKKEKKRKERKRKKKKLL